MKYRVIGSNKQTSARMILELQADSKAAAERKAMQAGMIVTRVEDASIVREDIPAARPVSRRQPGGSGWLMQVIVIAVIAAVIYYFWPQIMSMIGRK